ncbi:unnamed protein product [Clonostachys chloroleuca]|uniref:Aminoglycoside phosphotransferase domain-containing protein n=1 Tax=Clonostachys chloroleuca TaxID=1926264 RepID=A0AA35Q8K0_9HYPO|nr:unnamed protein product [Clonostachys chloroleuca]
MSYRASSHWDGFGDQGPRPSPPDQQVLNVLTIANFQYLQGVALRARQSGAEPCSPDVCCTIDPERFTYGSHHVVIEVAFSDQVYWLARIRHSPIDDAQSEGQAMDMLSEIATMKTLKSQTTIPVPCVFAFSTSSRNEFGFPYTLMEALPGRTLGGVLAKNILPKFRPKVASQFAEILFQLENISFDTLGRISCGQNCDQSPEIIPVDPEARRQPSTSLEWFYNERQQENKLAMAQHIGDKQWISACWILKAAISHIISEDRVYGPFPLCHPDLHYGNILFDEEYNITGIIDWDSAQTVPLERLAVSPEFITFPGLSPEENQDTINFRKLVVTHLRDLESTIRTSSENAIFLSDILGTKAAEITHRCTYSFPHRAIFDARLVAALMYGPSISWEQLVDAYGEMDLN